MAYESLLQVTALSKAFPGVQALDKVQLEVRRGEVHALVGENGAGKSTLVRILAGLEQPDAGEIWLRGEQVRIDGPHQALRLGLSMMHQELMPFPELTVAENILMGQEPASSWLGWIDRTRLRQRAAELLARLGVRLVPSRKMKDLSVAEMQTVELAKALAYNAELIIMDEPTSSLADREVVALLNIVDDLRRRGVAVIYISHKMNEIFRLADRVTVLRDGRNVATRRVDELDENCLITLMVGREWGALFPKDAGTPGEEVLVVRGLCKAGSFSNIDLHVRRGEIVGLAGLMGAGRTEVASALFGLAPADAGEIWIQGQRVWLSSPREALRHGVAMVSEDRKGYGLVLPMSVEQNITLASLGRCGGAWWIDRRRERALAAEQIRAFSIKTRGGGEPVEWLSGGNQQKVVLAKVLLTDPAILILDEPTRGIDINAKAEIYALIARLAREGKAILLVSSDLPELLSLSDRILVLRQGRIAAKLEARQTTPEQILQHAMPL